MLPIYNETAAVLGEVADELSNIKIVIALGIAALIIVIAFLIVRRVNKESHEDPFDHHSND